MPSLEGYFHRLVVSMRYLLPATNQKVCVGVPV